jgi:hypothetical protein
MTAAFAAPGAPADAAAPAAAAVSAVPADNLTPAEPAACSLLWQIKVQLGAGPRSLLVDMVFDAGPRTRTRLRLPDGWAGVEEISVDTPASMAIGGAALSPLLPRLQAVADAPTLRTVNHAAGERVQLRWRLTPPADLAQGGSVQLADTWFALAGQGVLPVPEEIDERHPPSACIGFYGLTSRPDDAAPVRWASSHGLAEGPTALFRVASGPSSLHSRVQQALYAGGALQTQTQSQTPTQTASRSPEGGAMTLARPASVAWRFSLDALGQAAAQALAAQRQFWGDASPASPLLVLLLPNASAGVGRGSAWHQALALQGPADLALPGSAADALLTEALVRSWVPDRFGPLRYAGRSDAVDRAWFSEGWADFYTHRLLLRDGHWTPDDYAAALNRKIERFLDASAHAKAPARDAGSSAAPERPGAPPAAEMAGARGEWLALQWHAALRAAGQPGLDATMRRLLLAPALARHEGPISAPLATHRLVAALRPVLGDLPLRDITRQADQGEAPVFGPDSLGPCFVGQRTTVATWRLGFAAVSLVDRVVSGVEPGGPAEAAGLRDGMLLTGHLLVPGDPTQAVQLKVMDAKPDSSGAASSGTDPGSAHQEIREIRYLPAGEPLRELPRYQPVAQAMQQADCLGWLGLGPDAGFAQGATGGTSSAAAARAAATHRHGARTASKSAAKATTKSIGKTVKKSGAKTSGKVKGRTAGPTAAKRAAKSGKPGSAAAR